jgi:hypothetical protein
MNDRIPGVASRPTSSNRRPAARDLGGCGAKAIIVDPTFTTPSRTSALPAISSQYGLSLTPYMTTNAGLEVTLL